MKQFIVLAVAMPLAWAGCDDTEASKGTASVVLAADALVFGKDLEGWLEDYWRWYVTGGASEVTPHKPGADNLVFMPLPQGTPADPNAPFTAAEPGRLVGRLEVTLPADTGFVLPLFSWISETYQLDLMLPDDVPIPAARLPNVGTNLDRSGTPELTLDGKPILLDFKSYIIDTPFDPIITYPEATDYGAIAAIHIQTAGFITGPLTSGIHTVHLLERLSVTNDDVAGYDNGVIFDNTWVITVP